MISLGALLLAAGCSDDAAWSRARVDLRDVRADAGASDDLEEDAPTAPAPPPGERRGPGVGRGILYAPDRAANADDMASYPHAIRLAHSGDANGTIIATFERQLRSSSNPGRGWLFYRSTDDGATFTSLGPPLVPARLPASATNALQPALLELSRPAGGYPAGTLLFSGVTAADGEFEVQVYRSTDGGATWSWISNVDTATFDNGRNKRRTWEPFLIQLDDGRIVAFWADELAPGGRQNIVRKVSTDGGVTWGPKVSVWESAVEGDRPGMPTVTRMGDGRWVMAVELCGAPADFCRARIKVSEDGLVYGTGPRDLGVRPMTTTNHPFHGTPFITWSPAGGPKGTLILSARSLMRSLGEPEVQAGGFGQTLLVNHDGGQGPWHELIAPLPWVGGATNSQAGYRNALLPSTDGTRLLYFAASYTGPGVRNELLYGTANAGVLPYEDPFRHGTDVGWKTYGGSWSLEGTTWVDSAGGPGDKAVAGSTAWTDYTIEGDVRVDGDGNAGLLFRVTDPNPGTDALDGYFVGLSTEDGGVFLGRHRFDWRPIGPVRPMPGGVAKGTFYRVSVQAVGCTFTVSAKPADGDAVTFTETDAGCSRFGQIGVRTFRTRAAWRDLKVTPGLP